MFLDGSATDPRTLRSLQRPAAHLTAAVDVPLTDPLTGKITPRRVTTDPAR